MLLTITIHSHSKMFKNLLKRSGANTPTVKSAAPGIVSSSSGTALHGTAPSLEVFQSHWRQALGVIKKNGGDAAARFVLPTV